MKELTGLFNSKKLDKLLGKFYKEKSSVNFIDEKIDEEINTDNIKKVRFLDEIEIKVIENCLAELDNGEKDDGSFRIQKMMKCMLTYPDHLPKEEYIKWFEDKIGKCKFIRIAHETGKSGEHDYEHSHVLIELEKPFSSTKKNIFHFKDFRHPQFKYFKMSNMLHWKNSVRYLGKEDPDNKDLLTVHTNFVDEIWSKNKEDALQSCQRPADAMGILTLWKNKPMVMKPPKYLKELGGETCPHNFMRWQHNIHHMMKFNTQGNRKITWIYDAIGGKGKSCFADDLVAAKIAYKVKSNGGGYIHCNEMIGEAYESGLWNGENIIFDWPRQTDFIDRKGLYGLIEAIKDGTLSRTKYIGKTINIQLDGNKNTQVFIFANFLPQYKDEHGHLTLSLDRWDVHEIGKHGGFNSRFHKTQNSIIKNIRNEFEKNQDEHTEDEEESWFDDTKIYE